MDGISCRFIEKCHNIRYILCKTTGNDSRTAKRTAYFLVEKHVIENEDMEAYAYGRKHCTELVMKMIRLRETEKQPEIFQKNLYGEENYRLVVETLKRRKRENQERLRSHEITF